MDGALKVIDFFEIGFGIGSWSLSNIDDLLSKVFPKIFWGDRPGFNFFMISKSRVVSLGLPYFGKLYSNFDGETLQWRLTLPTLSLK